MKKANRHSRVGGNLTIVIFLFLCIVFTASKAQIQNLIPDSSFEDIDKTIPNSFVGFNQLSNHWFSPIQTTPDLYIVAKPPKNEKKKSKYPFNTGLISPKTLFGFQYPKTGEAFAGFIASDISPSYKESFIYKEYIAVKLTKPLLKGQCYLFKMFLSLPDLSKHYGMNVGCSFLSEEVKDKYKVKHDRNPIMNPIITSQIDTFKLNADIVFNLENFKDTVNWVSFSSSYNAKGGEEYIVIGAHGKPNFKTILSNRVVKISKSNTLDAMVYYFIDDVSLVEQPDTNQCICKKVVPDTVIKEPVAGPIITQKPYIIPNLNFDTDSWDIKTEAFPTLDSLVQTIINLKGYKMKISGYTDDVGGDVRNLHLSQNRAKAVAEYLIAKGINKNTITYKGYGETMPLNPATTEEARRQNRRVEIKLIKE